jgi:hypothetical protein
MLFCSKYESMSNLGVRALQTLIRSVPQLLGAMFYPGNPSGSSPRLFTEIGRFVLIFNLAEILKEPEAQLQRIYLFKLLCPF